MEAIGHAGTCLGILAEDGVLLAAEKKNTSKLLDSTSAAEKVFKIDAHVACSVAGITADANILVKYLRESAQRHLLTYDEPMPMEQLVTIMCDTKQAYTQSGGLRPFGVSLLYMGWDRHHGFQLYQSDPSGNYGGWKAACIGANGKAAEGILKQEYKEGCNLHEAMLLAVKVLSKTMDSTTLSSEKLEFATLTRADGKPVFSVLSAEDVGTLLAEGKKLAEEEAAAEKAKKEAKARERKAKK